MNRILFTIFLAIDCAALGAFIGRLSLDSPDALVGGAVIFWYLLFGFVTGLTAGIFLSGIINKKIMNILNSILGIAALSFIIFIFIRISN